MDFDVSKTEVVDLVQGFYQQLVKIWSVYGFPTATLEKRSRAVFNHTKELYVEMLTEEEKRLAEKQEELKSYREAVAKLCRDLQQQDPPMIATTLVQQCEEMLNRETELKEKKAQKMKKWIELKKEEKALKESLGETFAGDVADFDGIPGQRDVESLNVVLSELKSEKVHRDKEFVKIKIHVKDLLKKLEKTQMSVLERKITEEVSPLLSLDYLAKCKEMETNLATQVSNNQLESERLRGEIEELERRLKDDPAVASEITLPTTHTPTALALIRGEHSRLTQLKMSNLENFIVKVRNEIVELADVLYMKAEKVMPELTEPSEHSLSLHENVLQGLKSYQMEHKKLLDTWRKRQTLWDQWLEYERKADDPNRFNNRGGALLREEKQRKLLEKSLPKLESEIKEMADAAPDFKIYNEEVRDLIAQDWNEYNREKEEKKLSKKQQSGTNNTMNVTRKRPMTPMTPGIGTPAGKRGKMTVSNEIKPPATPKRTLRSSTSKDNLPSPTYSEFTSHKHIFQSTMNEARKKGTPNPTPVKSPGRTRNAQMPRMTPREIRDKF